MKLRDRKRERWTAYGLLHPPQRVYRTDRRGADFVPHPDTAARKAIISPYLADGHTLAEAADELILQGYDPVKPILVRHWLVNYCDQWIEIVALRRRHRGAADTAPSTQRAHIQRKLRTLADQASMTDAARDTLAVAWLGANGILPRHLQGMLMPSDDQPSWRRLRDLLDPAQSTDARLMQALADGRELAVSYAEQVTSLLAIPSGMALDDWVRELLPGHICKTRHSLPQALLATAVLSQLDPHSSTSAATWAGPKLLETLVSGTTEIGGLLGTLGS